MATTHLVDHHDRQQVTDCSKEQSVHVMLHILADGIAERIQKHLSHGEDQYSKRYMSQRPAIVERAHDQEKLHGEVDDDTDCVEEVQRDEEAGSIGWTEAAVGLESQDGDDE